MKVTRASLLASVLSLLTSAVVAGLPPIGAAPAGDPATVASRIIKYNFPSCKEVTNAIRAPDGSIRALCDGTQYLVFTVFNARESKTLELALNCTAAEQFNVRC